MNVGYMISAHISMIAQHDSSRLGFPALITALCKARGVPSDSLTFKSFSPAINVAYVKKNCWNLDDLTVTFRGPCKAKGKRSEALPSFEIPFLQLLHLLIFLLYQLQLPLPYQLRQFQLLLQDHPPSHLRHYFACCKAFIKARLLSCRAYRAPACSLL